MSTPRFPLTFAPAAAAVALLSRIAAGETITPAEAGSVLDDWQGALASPEQIAAVNTSDDLEVDDEGACVSESDDGYFIQTWTWVANR